MEIFLSWHKSLVPNEVKIQVLFLKIFLFPQPAIKDSKLSMLGEYISYYAPFRRALVSYLFRNSGGM